MPAVLHPVGQVEEDQAEQEQCLLDGEDFLALESIVTVRLLLELVNLVPERVVGDSKDLIGVLLEELCLIKLERNIYQSAYMDKIRHDQTSQSFPFSNHRSPINIKTVSVFHT